MITKKRIDILFEDLWPGMEYCSDHHKTCLRLYPQIEKLFLRNGKNWNELILALDSLEGIGPTIASGLIWTSYPNRAVPFDKYTISYCLHKTWVRTNKITTGYEGVCFAIRHELDKWCWTDGCRFTIKDLVREARVEMEYSEWLIEPL